MLIYFVLNASAQLYTSRLSHSPTMLNPSYCFSLEETPRLEETMEADLECGVVNNFST